MGLTDVSASSLPSSWQGLQERLPEVGASTYIFFICDNDSSTGQPWCPDVRVALPIVKKFFSMRAEDVSVVSVGSIAEWKSPKSIFRTKWDLTAIPSLAKYTRTADGITQSQLVDDGCKDSAQLKTFVQ